MSKRIKILLLVCGGLLTELAVTANVPWCDSASFLIVNRAHEPLAEVLLVHDGMVSWKGLLGNDAVEQVTLPVRREGGVGVRVTFGNGIKLTHYGVYVSSGNPGYAELYVEKDRITYSPVMGSGYLGLGGHGGFALALELADLAVRSMVCPVRWLTASISADRS